MPRRSRVTKRTIAPDPIYNNLELGKFVNCVMIKGKKSLAERIIYTSFEKIRSTTKKEPLDIFSNAMRNVTPLLEVKPKRVGGATYQVPVEVGRDRKGALARRWIINSARKRGGKSMADKLAAEIIDASNGTGSAVKRKEDTHKMAESNKAFSHFRY